MYSVAMKTDVAGESGLMRSPTTHAIDVTDGFELQDRFSGGALNVSPEVRLQIAVLEDAVDRISTLRRAHMSRVLHVREAEELREIERWVSDDSVDWPYAFVACCESLRLDPSAMREQLLHPGFFVSKRIRKHIAGVVRTHTQNNRRRMS